jgi:hypothetical protein
MGSDVRAEPTEQQRALRAVLAGALLGAFLALVGRRR